MREGYQNREQMAEVEETLEAMVTKGSQEDAGVGAVRSWGEAATSEANSSEGTATAIIAAGH